MPHDRSTSFSLLERVRVRDDEAWGRLVELYSPLVAYWCNNSGVRRQDADDLVQEVFQAVFKSLDSFRRDRAGDTFRGWLRRITHFKVQDYFRVRAAQPAAQGGTDPQWQLQQIPQPELPEETPEDLGALYRRALELVRSEFEDRTWQAFWRAALENQPPAEIAEDLGMSPAAVRKAKSRVLHRLRQEVGDLID